MLIRRPKDEDKEQIQKVIAMAVVPLRKIYRPTKVAIAHKASHANLRTQLICESNGKVVATVQYEDIDDRLHLLGPMVHPDCQRRGIAKLFIGHIAALANDMGKRALSLYTYKQTGNVAIFSRLGFQVISESAESSSNVENMTDETLIDVYMEREVETQPL